MQLKRVISVLSLLFSKLTEIFSSGSKHKEWKDHQGIIHNTYNGGNIKMDRHVILLISEDVAKHLVFHNFMTPVPGMLREFLDNNTTTG